MLYDVFDLQERAEGFRWLRPEELDQQERDFQQSLVGVKKGAQTKRRKEFGDSRARWTRPPIKPQPTFFHAHVEQSKLDCHPDRIHILTSQTGGK
jgi:hypothetical protein